jgi:hypothetical protein
MGSKRNGDFWLPINQSFARVLAKSVALIELSVDDMQGSLQKSGNGVTARPKRDEAITIKQTFSSADGTR